MCIQYINNSKVSCLAVIFLQVILHTGRYGHPVLKITSKLLWIRVSLYSTEWTESLVFCICRSYNESLNNRSIRVHFVLLFFVTEAIVFGVNRPFEQSLTPAIRNKTENTALLYLPFLFCRPSTYCETRHLRGYLCKYDQEYRRM